MVDEPVLVIPTKKLYEKGKWSGFRQDNLLWFRQVVDDVGQFRQRSEVEDDFSWKQVISQIIFVYRKKIYFHQISDKGSEERLRRKYPIFLGGHVNPIDRKPGVSLLDAAAERELFEEVQYRGSFLRKDFVGVVNIDDDNMVNRVHVGFVFVFEGDSPDMSSRERNIKGLGLKSVKELQSYLPQMTFWSQIVYPYFGELI